LKCFSLKSYIKGNEEFRYLKWLLNNVHHVRTLHLCLESESAYRQGHSLWGSLIDAHFVRQYCLPDVIPNLIDFKFSLTWECPMSVDDIAKIRHSFQTDPFFVGRHWSKIQCFYDPGYRRQRLFSSWSFNTLPMADDAM
jgi:hypothetical protein